MVKEKKVLGKGLSALLGQDFQSIENNDFQSKGLQIDVDLIDLNPYQPRTEFNDKDLAELALSIQKHGIVQPIVVRRKGLRYQLIAGERRLQACKRLQLDIIPAIIKEIDDRKMFEMALIENIQRENLNPMEEATAYAKLMEKYSYTQEQLSNSLGKSRSHIANLMRLLKLPSKVQEFLRERRLSLGHAKLLVNQENAEEMAEKIVKEGLSVKELASINSKKQLSDQSLESARGQKNALKLREKFPAQSGIIDDLQDVSRMLEENLGLKVFIRDSHNGGGRLSIDFDTLEQLDYIIQKLTAADLSF